MDDLKDVLNKITLKSKNKKEITRSSIFIHVNEYEIYCASCKETITAGKYHLSGIESCCGNCYRQLCFDCVKLASNLIKEHKE